MSACPPPQVLEDAAAGKANVSGEVSTHLIGCSMCRTALEDIRQNNAMLTQITALTRSSRAHREHPIAPPVVDDYEILECVAQGGQGVVYRAIQKRTKRCVALKMLLGGQFATPRQRGRFEREVELAAGLHHPNIVTVHDSGITPDGRPFLSMAFIEGRPLDQWARSCRAEKTGMETIRRLVGVFIKVCGALSFAHMRGVLHRDLKPGNILVDANDEPHIVDFGLAKLVDCETMQHATMTGEFMGTIAYAAPEQVSGGGNQADARSDVYAFGVLLYEVLTGSLPFPVSGAIADVIWQITRAEPSAPSRMGASIPADLDTIVLKAMAKDVNRRYQSARDLGEDLRRFLANEPIIARSESTWYLLRKVAHRHRRTLVAGAVAALALLLGVVAVTVYVVFNARAVAAKAQAEAEMERADAMSLVLHSAGLPRSHRGDPQRYDSRDLERLEVQIKFGWLGDDRRRESATASLLAGLYRYGGSAADAEELVRQAMVQRLLELGPDHPDTARGLRDLAEVMLVRNRLEEAIRHCQRAQAIDKNVYGDDSLETARDEELLARILVAKGDSKSAASLAANAIAIQSAKLGDETTELAQSLDTRSAAMFALGDLDGAEVDCVRSLRLRFALLQDENPAVAQSLRRMAAISDRRPDTSFMHLLAKALGTATSSGEIAGRLRELAADLVQLSVPDYTKSISSISVLRRILVVKEAVLGKDHKGLLSTLAALATEFHILSDYGEEAVVLAQALSILEKSPKADKLAIANCLEMRGVTLINLARYGEGIELLERSADIWWSLPADRRDDVKAAVSERGLAFYLAMDGQYEKAARRAQHCIDAIRRVEGPEHHVIAHAQGIRAWALMHLGRFDEAEREAREALALGERLNALMPGGQRIQLPYYLGSILIAEGKLDEGQRLIQSAWDGTAVTEADRISGRAPHDRLHQRLVEDMIRICVARGDAACETRWRKELPGSRG